MQCTKGMILAGGSGSRLYPLTLASNKQLLPIYDKPVIYYPLTVLMLSGIRHLLIIGRSQDIPILEALLGSGEKWGMHFEYAVQEEPRGLPDAFIVGEKFIQGDPVALILGDNFFYGQGFSSLLGQVSQNIRGAHTFLYHVEDPRRYGVMVLDEKGHPHKIVEKPKDPPSKLAITGLYYFDGSVSDRANHLKPSRRGELEITDLVKTYMEEKRAFSTLLQRGYAWFDVGTPDALLNASQYVEVVQSRQGVIIASPEEVAWRMGWIKRNEFENLIAALPPCTYATSLRKGLEYD